MDEGVAGCRLTAIMAAECEGLSFRLYRPTIKQQPKPGEDGKMGKASLSKASEEREDAIVSTSQIG
jgi:hypothetical protein